MLCFDLIFLFDLPVVHSGSNLFRRLGISPLPTSGQVAASQKSKLSSNSWSSSTNKTRI